MKNYYLLVLFLITITVVVWSTGTQEISDEELEWMEKYDYEVVSLVEDIDIESEAKHYEFVIVPRKTSSRYRIAFHFPAIDFGNLGKVLSLDNKARFTEDFSFIVIDLQTGEKIAQYNNQPFQYGRYKDDDYYWDLFSLKLRKGSEYKLSLTIPGISNIKKELQHFRLICYVSPKPFL